MATFEPSLYNPTHHEEDIHPSRFLFLPVYRQQCRHGLRSVETVSITVSKNRRMCETPAKYGTGDAELMADVAKLIKYPKDCDENEIQGLWLLGLPSVPKAKQAVLASSNRSILRQMRKPFVQ